jgi:hypothetical protein
MNYDELINDLPFRECKGCNDISYCRNLDTEPATGKMLIPDNCPKKIIRQLEIDKNDLKKVSYV